MGVKFPSFQNISLILCIKLLHPQNINKLLHQPIVKIHNIKKKNNDKTNINNNDNNSKPNNKVAKARVLQVQIQNLYIEGKVYLVSSNNNMKKKFFKIETKSILIDLTYRRNYY